MHRCLRDEKWIFVRTIVEVISISDGMKEYSQKLTLTECSSFPQPPHIVNQKQNSSGEWLGASSVSVLNDVVTASTLLCLASILGWGQASLSTLEPPLEKKTTQI